MRRQVDSYSMLICSKYVSSILDMINITLVNSKFKESIDKFHFNPFKINTKTRKYFINLQTQWLFDEDDELFTDGDISGYYVYYEVSYHNYLEIKNSYQTINFRRIIYTENDRKNYGNQIPNVVKKLGVNTFFGTIIKEINIPDSVVEIGNYCFYCYQKTLEYPTYFFNLDDRLFYNAKGLSKVSIPTSITRIGDGCFSYCNLTSLTIPSNVVYLGKSVFCDNYALKEVELPNNMMELYDGTFYGCTNLTKINIPSSITKIGVSRFEGCIKLKEINIPMSVASIGECAFKHCSELQSITGNVDVCIAYKESFENTPFLNQIEKKRE